MKTLEEIHIPRVTVPHLSKAVRRELWTYSDASEKAIAAVSYLKVFYQDGSAKTGFVLGKAKVAPVSGHTIPRLEPCTAVLAIDISQIAIEHMDMTFDSVKYFTDSRVVLGYIHNDKRRFFLCMYQTELTEFVVLASQSNGNLYQRTSTLLMKVQEECFLETLKKVHG